MAYFDSKKNRALWEIELQALRKEKAERAAGKRPEKLVTSNKEKDVVHNIIRTSYKELLIEEARESAKTPRKDAIQNQHIKQKEDIKERQKEGRTYEMS